MRHRSLNNVSVTGAFASGPMPSADYMDYYYGHLSIRLTCSAANGIRGLSGGCAAPLDTLMDGSSAKSSCLVPYHRYGTKKS